MSCLLFFIFIIESLSKFDDLLAMSILDLSDLLFITDFLCFYLSIMFLYHIKYPLFTSLLFNFELIDLLEYQVGNLAFHLAPEVSGFNSNDIFLSHKLVFNKL